MRRDSVRGGPRAVLLAALLGMPLLATAQAPTGGPDAGGYSYADSTAPGGPAFNYINISETGTLVLNDGGGELTDDDLSAPIPVGFEFWYYGELVTEVIASSNGFVKMGTDLSNSGCCSGHAIPQPGSYYDVYGFGEEGLDGLIALWWQDLVGPGAGDEVFTAQGAIRHQTIGEAPNRVFILEYDDVFTFATWSQEDGQGPGPARAEGEEVRMQLHLIEGTNVIEVHYDRVVFEESDFEFSFQGEGGSGQPVTAGIESPGGVAGLEYFHGFGTFETPRAVRYTPGFIEDCDENEVPDAAQLEGRATFGFIDNGTIVRANDRATRPDGFYEFSGEGGPGRAPVSGVAGLDYDADGNLWVATDVDRQSPFPASTLARVDPETSEVLEEIGVITFPGPGEQPIPVAVTDLAILPGTNRLFAAGYDDFQNYIAIFEVDTTSGDATLLGVTPETEGGGLAFDDQGRLFLGGISVIHELVSPASNGVLFDEPDFDLVLRSVNPIPAGFFYYDSLAFNPNNGQLVYIDSFFDSTGSTYLIDPDTLEGRYDSRSFVVFNFGQFIGDLAFQLPADDANNDGVVDECEIIVEPGDCDILAETRLRSSAELDGTVLENLSDDPTLAPAGGAVNNGIITAQVGDRSTNAQAVAVYHFDLPGDRNLSAYESAYLRFTLMSRSGRPQDTLGELVADMKAGAFGDDLELLPADFEAPADLEAAAVLPPLDFDSLANGASLFLPLSPEALALLSQAESVQFRVRYSTGTDGDSRSDFLTLGTGELGEDSPYTAELVLRYLPADCGDCQGGLLFPPPGQGGQPRFAETLIATSIGALDGDAGESIAQAEIGHRSQYRSAAFNVGDNANNGQTVGILAFDTSEIPQDALVTGASVILRRVGSRDDASVLGDLHVDLFCSSFGPLGRSNEVEPEDFHWWAHFPEAGTFDYPAFNGAVVSATIDPLSLGGITRGGITQARIRFANASDNDRLTDTLTFYSGEVREEYRPMLVVDYAVPARPAAVTPAEVGEAPVTGGSAPGAVIETFVGQVRRDVPVDTLTGQQLRGH